MLKALIAQPESKSFDCVDKRGELFKDTIINKKLFQEKNVKGYPKQN